MRRTSRAGLLRAKRLLAGARALSLGPSLDLLLSFLPVLPVLVLCFVSTGCQSSPRKLAQAELLSRQSTFQAAYADELERMSSTDIERIANEYRLGVSGGGHPAQSHDVLVLSGGGQFGAFGAGFLDGWGRVQDEEFGRPRFDVVSGISTGAMIAPFAFVGTEDSYAALVEHYSNPNPEWVRSRGLLSFLPSNSSLLDASGLRENVRTLVDPGIVEALARGGREGRQLVVGATSLDFGELRVWDLARFASQHAPDTARQRISTLLAASSAIPGVFEPVEIDDLLFVDGAATMAIVGGLSDRRWLYSSDSESSASHLGDVPVRIRVWVIVNQKLLPEPKLIKPSWANIMSRSVDTVLRTALLQTIQDAETYVQLLNARREFDARLYYVAIPQEFEVSTSDALFDEKLMRELVELGRAMGADPESWRTSARRPGASKIGP